MTFEPSDPIALTPTTTRVGSGTSARLIALAVAGVLVSVVGYAFVNRPPPPPAAVALANATPEPPPTPLPTPTPPRNQLHGNDGIFSWPVVAQLPLGRPGLPVPIDRSPTFTYVVLMEITGGTIRAALERQLAEAYAGSVVVVSSDVGDTLVIEVGRQWEQDGLTIFESFGSSAVELRPLRKSRAGRITLLVEYVPPSMDSAVPGPIASGYTFTILGRREGSLLTLSLQLVVPISTQIAAYVGPRGPGLFNRCRWEVGPQAAPPRGNQDEAGCLEI